MQDAPGIAFIPIFLATVEATEEAIVKAMIAAEDMTGTDGHYAEAINHGALRDVLRQYKRPNEEASH